ncbi:phage exclusion protein Lit family protein [Stenotrophomonas hibiscicola]|uniref:phage exclusion protein Lit family protein n=1 Tax=Stenotrophomonas hibiscicola TaxID=86189 RepID=UPI003D13EFFD
MNGFRQEHDAALQQVIRSTIQAIAPERAEELDSYWAHYDPEIQMASDGAGGEGVVMQAGLYRFIQFNHRTMRLFWLSSFLLWEGYEATYRYAETGLTDTTRFEELYDCFQATLHAADVDAVAWPAGIPSPGELVEHVEGEPGRVAGELAIFSVVWAFLHEVRHLMHQQDGTSAAADDPSAARQEELSCDRFATDFLLTGLPNYSAQTGQPLDLVQMKRQTSIYGALFAMALFGQSAWAESDSHPSLQKRIDETVATMEGHGFNLIAAAIGTSAFSTLKLRFNEAPSPLAIASVVKAFEHHTLA